VEPAFVRSWSDALRGEDARQRRRQRKEGKGDRA
jgi:hypothetical protein